jgi:hypothetical protein
MKVIIIIIKRAPPIALLVLVIAIVTRMALAQEPQPPQPQPQPQPQPTNTGTCWGFGCDKQTPTAPTATTQPPPPAQQPTATSTIPYVTAPTAAPPPKDKDNKGVTGDDDDDKPGATKASVKLEMGATYRRIYGFDAIAMDGRFGVGARNRKIGHYFVGGFFWGEMTEHLRTYSVMFGYNLEIYPVDPIRLGFGIEPGFLWIRRASYDSRLFAPGIEVFVHGGADLIKLGQNGYHAMYIDLRLQAGLYIDNAPMWGPTLSLGFRF